MKEIFVLDGSDKRVLPGPHDCEIKQVEITKEYLVLYFENDISKYDSVKYLNPNAKSLIIRYHLVDDLTTYEYTFKGLFRREGFQLISNEKLKEFASTRLEYLYTYEGYNSLILKLWHHSSVMLEIYADKVEYEWILKD